MMDYPQTSSDMIGDYWLSLVHSEYHLSSNKFDYREFGWFELIDFIIIFVYWDMYEKKNTSSVIYNINHVFMRMFCHC